MIGPTEEASTLSFRVQLTITRSLVIATVLLAFAHIACGERPNILWITAEDMSSTLGCQGGLSGRGT